MEEKEVKEELFDNVTIVLGYNNNSYFIKDVIKK